MSLTGRRFDVEIGFISTKFVSVDRNQPLLLPPDHDTIAKFRLENFDGVAACFVLEMKEKMERDESREKYRLRKQTVEPVFGAIKKWMGFTQFQLGGRDNVSGEWKLITLAYNMKRLWKMQNEPKLAVSPG